MSKIIRPLVGLFVVASLLAQSAQAQQQKTVSGPSVLFQILEARQPITVATAAEDATVKHLGSEPKMITVPAGTHVIMQLISPLDTESAVEGTGVYLETIFPVIVGDEVAIPAKSYVTGTIETEKRAGHVARVASFRMHFTQMTLSGKGTTSTIDGVLLSLPGSSTTRRDKNSGSVARADQLDKALPLIADGALAGAVLGSVRKYGIGKWAGAGLGTGIAAGGVLLTRGNEIHLQEGAKVEMALEAPLTVPASPLVTQFQVQALVEHAKPAARAENGPSTDSQRSRAKSTIGRLLSQQILRAMWR
ncbi:MAG: hypothetical protein JOZ10_14680 [Acidobacteria bacterium]|nr:hypothetical protein [Acidobacteriota bacterium]